MSLSLHTLHIQSVECIFLEEGAIATSLVPKESSEQELQDEAKSVGVAPPYVVPHPHKSFHLVQTHLLQTFARNIKTTVFQYF